MSNEKLKPCPFCGGDAVLHSITGEHDPDSGGSFIECFFCKASSAVVFGEKTTLVERWNRRSEQGNAPDLYHACMSAGEDACEWLEGMGLAYDSGSYCVLTQKGIDVYNAESQEDFQTIAFKAYK